MAADTTTAASTATAPGPLERQLLSYSILPSKKDPWYIRLHQYLLGNKITMTLTVASFILEAVETKLAPGSVLQAQAHVSVLTGTYSCFFANLLLYRKGRELRQWINVVAGAVASTERGADPVTAAAMARTAWRGRTRRRLLAGYGTLTLLFVVFNLCAEPVRWVALLVDASPAAKLLEWTSFAVSAVGAAACLNAYHYVLPMASTLHEAAADVFDVTARCLERAPCSRRCAALQSTVLRACLQANECLALFMPQLLVGLALVGLLGVVDVVSSGGVRDLYSLTTMPILVALFGPLCLVGERLKGARRGVGASAYRGPWLEEAPPLRRDRRNLMTAADGRGASFRGSGIGTLDKPLCLAVLKSWFSFVQLLMSLYD